MKEKTAESAKTYSPEALKVVELNIVFANFFEDVEVALRLIQRGESRAPIKSCGLEKLPGQLQTRLTYATSMVEAQLVRCC